VVNHASSHVELEAMARGFRECSDDLLLLATNADADRSFLKWAPKYGLELHRNGPDVGGRTPYVCTVFGPDDQDRGPYAAGYTAVQRVASALTGPAELLANLPFMILRAS
jgi:hypothetical protein